MTRVNNVMDYIENNLDGDLSLEALAHVAHFSPFHFHRIFRALVGETLHQFVHRLRLEKAAQRLLTERQTSVTTIALDVGFSGSAVFARAFKTRFGQSASAWRRSSSRIERPKYSKIIEQNLGLRRADPSILRWELDWPSAQPVIIEVRRQSPCDVVYLRHIGAYQGDGRLFAQLFGRLTQWAQPRRLLEHHDACFMTLFYDNPSITDEEKLRVDACLSVPKTTEASGPFGRMQIAGGEYGVGRFMIGPAEYAQAWQMMMGVWLPESGFQPDDRRCYEHYGSVRCSPNAGKSVVEICIPVRPL